MEYQLKPMKRTWMLCFLLCLLLSIKNIAVADQYPDEVHLFKAAYIYNFGKLVSWPQETWQSQDSPFTLCTLGQDNVIGALKKLSGRKIKGHPVSIQSFKSNVPSGLCQLLYIAKSRVRHYQDTRDKASRQALLTVSEFPGFIDQGGIIELYREDNRTRFKINLGKARQRGLEISSRLLSLATVVEDKS
jgi:hypothetical protein